jgi:hypothetical protein
MVGKPGCRDGLLWAQAKRSCVLDFKGFASKSRTAFFGYGSIGYNFSWLREDQKIKSWGNQSANDERGGIFYEAGVGYKASLTNRFAFGLSAGYSYKEQSEKITFKPICILCVPPIPVSEVPKPEIYTYQFRRISVKLHCWF